MAFKIGVGMNIVVIFAEAPSEKHNFNYGKKCTKKQAHVIKFIMHNLNLAAGYFTFTSHSFIGDKNKLSECFNTTFKWVATSFIQINFVVLKMSAHAIVRLFSNSLI